MKKIELFAFFILIMSLTLYSQDSQNINELGISFTSTTSYGIKYKFGTNDFLYRISVLSINGSTNSTKTDTTIKITNNNAGLSFSLGFEKIKPIKGNLSYYYGLDLIESYSYQKSSTLSNSSWTLNSGIGGVLGFLYKINDNFNISTEIIPTIKYTYGKSGDIRANGLSIAGSTSGANITIAYRF